jgi:subtilisin family serine protease
MKRRVLAAVALAFGASAAPASASLLSDQWALAPSGQLRAPAAWQQSTGAGVTVAVLDTGVQLDRLELRGRIWTNPGEIAGNGRDDDGDGIADDVHGADFVNGDGVPADDEGHGTHVAGIIAARGLVRGLAPGATILPIKVLDSRKSGNAHWLAQGIQYAVARGARILNVSVNGDGVSAELEGAIRAAEAAGAVIVASAGNDGRDLGARPSYPISFPEASVIGVGATDARGERAAFSNHGAGVDITAPGDDILSLGRPGFAYRSGTSMAAAYAGAGGGGRPRRRGERTARGPRGRRRSIAEARRRARSPGGGRTAGEGIGGGQAEGQATSAPAPAPPRAASPPRTASATVSTPAAAAADDIQNAAG